MNKIAFFIIILCQNFNYSINASQNPQGDDYYYDHSEQAPILSDEIMIIARESWQVISKNRKSRTFWEKLFNKKIDGDYIITFIYFIWDHLSDDIKYEITEKWLAEKLENPYLYLSRVNCIIFGLQISKDILDRFSYFYIDKISSFEENQKYMPIKEDIFNLRKFIDTFFKKYNEFRYFYE